MAFYTVFPILFSLSEKVLKSSPLRIILAPAVFVAVSYIINKTLLITSSLSVQKNSFLYFNILNQLPVFVVGICYFKLWKLNRINFKTGILSLLFFTTTLVSLTLWRFTGIDSRFVFIPFVSGVSFVFLIEIFRTVAFLNFSMLKRIGQVSYSMYLIHFLFAHTVSRKLSDPVADIVGSDFGFVLLFFITVISTLLLALISEAVIERPSVALGKFVISKLPSREAHTKTEIQ